MISESAKGLVLAPPDTLRVSASASHLRPLPQPPLPHELSPPAGLPPRALVHTVGRPQKVRHINLLQYT